MAVLVLLLLFVLGLWVREMWIHQRALRSIPIRVHVNGSRGKSSVVRLIAAAMREGGVRTVAKTTGSKARFIHTDGNEEPVIRLGTPNICEQIGILDKARREEAQAIVMECMAVRPDLQKICEAAHHALHDRRDHEHPPRPPGRHGSDRRRRGRRPLLDGPPRGDDGDRGRALYDPDAAGGR